MNRRNVLPVGVAAAVMASAGIALLSASPASAATCSAPGDGACVAVTYQTSSVRSVRVNGRCLTGSSGQHPDVRIDRFDRPDVQTYGGSSCESGTHNSATVRVGNKDSEGYRWVWVS